MKKIQLENKEYIIDITKDTYSKLDKKGRREYRKQLSKEFKKYFDAKLNEVVSRSISVENLNVIKNIAFLIWFLRQGLYTSKDFIIPL